MVRTVRGWERRGGGAGEAGEKRSGGGGLLNLGRGRELGGLRVLESDLACLMPMLADDANLLSLPPPPLRGEGID